jgi:hypothetical protein
MELSFSYTLDQIFRYGYKPKFKKHSNVYNYSCPICKEGSSLGKKARGYFLVKENYFICHNCQKTWKPIDWIKEVSNKTYKEIIKESDNYTDSLHVILEQRPQVERKRNLSTLPHNCINLSDPVQLTFYKNNIIVQDVLEYINKRRLFTAINRAKTFYVSLTDKHHKNRLIIPFYNELGKIVFYQSRAIYKKDEDFSKYLSKVSSEFTVFGIDKINPKIDYLFLFEGPIDSMFVKNGLGLGGLRITELQKQQLTKYRFHNKIWILDNQLDNKNVIKKYQELIDKQEKIFCIPEKFKQFKDLNEMCIEYKLDQVSPKFIINNSFTGMQAKIRLKI